MEQIVISSVFTALVVGVYFFVNWFKELRIGKSVMATRLGELVPMVLSVLLSCGLGIPAFLAVGLPASLAVLVSVTSGLAAPFLFKVLKIVAKKKFDIVIDDDDPEPPKVV